MFMSLLYSTLRIMKDYKDIGRCITYYLLVASTNRLVWTGKSKATIKKKIEKKKKQSFVSRRIFSFPLYS